MSQQLPERPNLEHLKTQAKDLLSAFRSGDADAARRFASALPSLAGLRVEELATHKLALHDAQSAISREYGFDSWAKLVARVEEIRAAEGVQPETIERFVEVATSDQPNALKRLLELYPGLPAASPTTWFVCGEFDRAKRWLEEDPARATNAMNEHKYTPLDYVCYSHMFRHYPERKAGGIALAKLLLDMGADPNTAHPYEPDPGATIPVLYAASAESGVPELVEMLLERGANPNDCESVYHSAQKNYREILDILLAHGADISNTQQPYGNTPLYFLAGYRPNDIGVEEALGGCEWLLEHGADPNVPCDQHQRETPLHCACRCGGWRLPEMLLDHGADPNLRRADGRTAYALACITGNRKAAQLLASRGADTSLSPDDELGELCSSGQTEKAREMLSESPSLREAFQSQSGFLLAKLSEFNVLDGVRTMIALGADLGGTDREGYTGLHLASFCGHAAVVEELASHGAPLDVKDPTYHATPLGWALHAAAYMPREGADYVPIVRALLKAGASKGELQSWVDGNEVIASLAGRL